MPSIFEKIDKIRPLYDAVYKFVLFICKLLLVVDIAITSMSVAGRYISFIPDPAWSEEVVLSCMAYMAVLSAALAIRRGAHIRMTALDSYLPKKLVKSLDILADVAVLVLAVIMLTVGWTYASGIDSVRCALSPPRGAPSNGVGPGDGVGATFLCFLLATQKKECPRVRRGTQRSKTN
jgi:TRAP-type mannitol/chloroaromatic compound transport system permease small subunit